MDSPELKDNNAFKPGDLFKIRPELSTISILREERRATTITTDFSNMGGIILSNEQRISGYSLGEKFDMLIIKVIFDGIIGWMLVEDLEKIS